MPSALSLPLPTSEHLFLGLSLSLFLLTLAICWLRRAHLRQRHILLIYLLLTCSFSLVVVSLTDLLNFSLLGEGKDVETGRLIAGLLSFGAFSVIAVRLSGAYPLACAWWFVFAACCTILQGSTIMGIDDQYQAMITGIRLLAAGGAFVLVSRCKRHLNQHQYLSILAAQAVSVSFIIPSASDNPVSTLLATILYVLLWQLYRHERPEAPATAVIGLAMLLLFGLSEGLTALGQLIGAPDPSVDVAGFLLFGAATVWVWQRRQQLPRGVLWVALFSMVLLACMQFAPEEVSDQIFAGLVGVLLLFIATLYCYAGGDQPALPHSLRKRLTAAWSGCAFVLFIILCLSSYYLPLIALENNLGPARILAILQGTPVWTGDKRFVTIALKDEGLWPDQVRTATDLSTDLSGYITQIRPAADRYSSFESILDERNSQKGVAYGERGFSIRLLGKRCLLKQVAVQSPAGAARLKRGDQLLSIDGVAVSSFKDRQDFERYWDKTEQRHTLALKVREPSGRIRSVLVPLGTVHQDQTYSTLISTPRGTVGYLYLAAFNDASFANIRQEFARLRQAGVRDLVLDLRYNSGGNAGEAAVLAGLIAGQVHDGKLFIRAETSARYPDRASSYILERQPESLLTRRLVVLTTRETCSASETIINGLSPYLPVYTVGSATCGKPFLMDPIQFGGQILYPVTARVLSSRGVAEYTTGITPDRLAEDDLTRTPGDPQEGMLRTALQLLAAQSTTTPTGR